MLPVQKVFYPTPNLALLSHQTDLYRTQIGFSLEGKNNQTALWVMMNFTQNRHLIRSNIFLYKRWIIILYFIILLSAWLKWPLVAEPQIALTYRNQVFRRSGEWRRKEEGERCRITERLAEWNDRWIFKLFKWSSLIACNLLQGVNGILYSRRNIVLSSAIKLSWSESIVGVCYVDFLYNAQQMMSVSSACTPFIFYSA